MEEKFQAVFNRKPTLKVRCPGRVNLIGEHIDYNGYGVFPMAIEQETVVYLAANDEDIVRISNVDEQYGSTSVSLPTDWSGASPPQWFDYFLSGWKGIIDRLSDDVTQKGFDVLVGGTIPASSGLSSSSSVVCAAALATWILHTGKGFDGITREELADLCAVSERYVGTQGGGMDQAAEILSIEGRALRIDFNPLRSRAIQLPDQARLVVLHCGETLNKAATSAFNQRVVECRLAGKLLLRNASAKCESPRLKEVQSVLGASLEEMVQLSEKLPMSLTRGELEELLGEEMVDSCLSDNTRHLTSFTLRARARHVFSEALRVDLMEEACERGDMEEMGRLMRDSHRSCSQDYACSSDALDRTVSSCLSANALGARLTGAGWGGCVVALFQESSLDQIKGLDGVLFTTKPSAGISYEMLH